MKKKLVSNGPIPDACKSASLFSVRFICISCSNCSICFISDLAAATVMNVAKKYPNKICKKESLAECFYIVEERLCFCWNSHSLFSNSGEPAFLLKIYNWCYN